MNKTIKTLFTSTVIFGSALLLSACGHSQTPAMMNAPQMFRMQQAAAPQELLVRFTPAASRHDIEVFSTRYGLQVQGLIPELGVYVMRGTVSHQAQLQALMLQLRADRLTTMVEVNEQMYTGPVSHDMYVSPIFN